MWTISVASPCSSLTISAWNVAPNTHWNRSTTSWTADTAAGSPLIVTTNLTLDEIRHPQDTAHARIYDRLLEMCVPVSCIGVSFRKETAQEKLERLKLLIG